MRAKRKLQNLKKGLRSLLEKAPQNFFYADTHRHRRRKIIGYFLRKEFVRPLSKIAYIISPTDEEMLHEAHAKHPENAKRGRAFL